MLSGESREKLCGCDKNLELGLKFGFNLAKIWIQIWMLQNFELGYCNSDFNLVKIWIQIWIWQKSDLDGIRQSGKLKLVKSMNSLKGHDHHWRTVPILGTFLAGNEGEPQINAQIMNYPTFFRLKQQKIFNRMQKTQKIIFEPRK